MMREHLCRMARYTRWANQRLFDACSTLEDDVYHQPRRASFGSIHGTLNHILVGDRLWLARIEGLLKPDLKLDDQPYGDLVSLGAARRAEDERMIRLTAAYDDAAIDQVICYRMVTRPDEVETPLHLCWLHLFNHQTHHRGQVHDQLSQTDVLPPPLDLIYYLREHG
ncbi:MAG: DinB family protein [Alphaproteobacteria bacterium]|nr:DinB family protein [Alphaproteobacteria bacterium]